RISSVVTPSRMAAAAACLAIAAGTATLTGWATGIDELVRLFPGLAPMKPNTAMCFILCGVSLLLRLAPAGLAPAVGKTRPRDLPSIAVRGAATACALLAGGVGLVTLSEHILGTDTGLALLLFTDAIHAAGLPLPGRMTHVAAL